MITPDQEMRPRRRRGGFFRTLFGRVLAIVIAFIVIVVIIAVAASSGSKPAKPIAAASSSPASTAPAATQPAVAVPSPHGTFQGSCDYTLGDSPSTGTAEAIGDINAVNDGNVGIVVKLTITWPQEGYAPLSQSETVRIGYGGQQDVQFHRPLTGTELDRLQSYQLGHTGESGCTYNGSMTDTFGTAH